MMEDYVFCCILLAFGQGTSGRYAPGPTQPQPALETTTVSKSDLITISREMWVSGNSLTSPDYKRMEEGVDYTLDKAGNVLFNSMNQTKLNQTAYLLMKPLFDIYEPKTNVPESNNEQMRSAEEQFLQKITSKGPMRVLHDWLVANDLANRSMSDFIEELKLYWFYKYSRKGSSGAKGSSGWEHVFAGEYGEFSTKAQGYHNWARFYLDEKEGSLDYMPDSANACPDSVSSGFTWDGRYKPLSSMFVGTSPEYEMAVYTLCFITRPGRGCRVGVGEGDITLNIQTFAMTSLPVNTISTAYPIC